MLSIKEVAKLLGKSLPAIYKMVREKRKVGRNFHYIKGIGYRYNGTSIREEDL